VVNPQHRLIQCSTQGTRHPSTNQQRPSQPGAAGVGHHIHGLQIATAGLHDFIGQGQDAANVVAAGQFRHHATIGLVHLDLAVKRMRQQNRHLRRRIGRGHQGHAGFIA